MSELGIHRVSSQGKITITYEINNERKQKIFPATNFYRDEDFVFYVFYEGEMALCIREGYIEPLDNKTLKLLYIKYEKSFKYYNRTVLSNGLMSNSQCGDYFYTDRMNHILPVFINKKDKYGGDYDVCKNDNLRGSIYSHQFIGIGVKRKIDDDRYHLIADLDINESYNMLKTITSKDLLSFHMDLYGVEVSSKTKVLNLITIIDKEKVCFDKYFKQLHIKRTMPKPIVAWDYSDCRGKKATPEYILENLETMKQEKLLFELLVINNGYEIAVGDWLNLSHEFKDKMEMVIDEIHKSGRKVAIKLDPLICEKNSIIYNHHMHWILKDEKGKPIVVRTPKYGKKNLYILDIYCEEVVNHIKYVMDVMINKWGVDVFKLGTLFAGAILTSNHISRAHSMANVMTMLNEFAQGRQIIGDEIPISIAVGNTDYCCITPNVSRTWNGVGFEKMRLKETNSTLEAIRALVLRRMYNNRGFLSATYLCHLTRKHNDLTQVQRDTILQVASILGGLVFISESLNTMPAKNFRLLRSLFPKKNFDIIYAMEYERDVFVCHFKLEQQQYYMIVNCTNQEQTIDLNVYDLFCKETKKMYREHRGITLSEYSTKTFRKIMNDDIVCGSTGYVVPCGEILDISSEKTISGNNIIKITTEKDFENDNYFYLKPNRAFELYVNEKKCRMVDFDGQLEKYLYKN